MDMLLILVILCAFHVDGKSHPLIFAARRYASAVLAVIVCLSVCPSVTSQSCTKMAKPKITLRTAYDRVSQLILNY